jgi:hypothetical protein
MKNEACGTAHVAQQDMDFSDYTFLKHYGD